MINVIYQPDRVLLAKQIHAYSDTLRGFCLNLGCGNYDRYSHFFKNASFIHFDIKPTNLTAIVGDAHHLPFKDQVFDGILCT